jgi:adenine deaminase
MQTAVLRLFHWDDTFITMELPVADSVVHQDSSRNVTKFAIVDRFSGEGKTSKMFWLGTGPKTPDVALACSMGHDKPNIWMVGSSDAAMAIAVNALRENQGG